MRPIPCRSILTFIATFPVAVSAFASDVPTDREAFTGYAETKLQPEISTIPVSATGVLTLKIGPITDDLGQLYDICQSNPDGCDMAIHQHAQDVKQMLGIKR